MFFFFSSRRRHTRWTGDWSSDVCSSDLPEGVDPEIYHLEDRPPRAGLTTLMVAPVDDRKHVLKGVAAWKKVFGNDPEARLIIKTSYNYRNYTPDDVRISYIDRAEKTRGIAHWYRQADVLLALGNEGFGLPLVEGMATGRSEEH